MDGADDRYVDFTHDTMFALRKLLLFTKVK